MMKAQPDSRLESAGLAGGAAANESASGVKVSIVLAVYNERETIVRELEIIGAAAKASGEHYEIIVVDDASSDGTGGLLSALTGFRIIRHDSNRGSGAARKTGTLAANGNIIVWTDADLTYPNSLIPRLVEELEDRGLDQVIGARDAEMGSMKIFRVPAKYLIRRLAELLSRTSIPDLNSGLRVFRLTPARKYLHLVPDGFSCTSTMTLAFLCNGLSVGYVSVPYAKRLGRSKFRPLGDTYAYILQVIRMVMYFDPLRVFLPLSLALFLTGLASSLRSIFYLEGGLQQSDIIIFLTAVMVAVIGLLADLIVVQSKGGKR